MNGFIQHHFSLEPSELVLPCFTPTPWPYSDQIVITRESGWYFCAIEIVNDGSYFWFTKASDDTAEYNLTQGIPLNNIPVQGGVSLKLKVDIDHAHLTLSNLRQGNSVIVSAKLKWRDIVASDDPAVPPAPGDQEHELSLGISLKKDMAIADANHTLGIDIGHKNTVYQSTLMAGTQTSCKKFASTILVADITSAKSGQYLTRQNMVLWFGTKANDQLLHLDLTKAPGYSPLFISLKSVINARLANGYTGDILVCCSDGSRSGMIKPVEFFAAHLRTVIADAYERELRNAGRHFSSHINLAIPTQSYFRKAYRHTLDAAMLKLKKDKFLPKDVTWQFVPEISAALHYILSEHPQDLQLRLGDLRSRLRNRGPINPLSRDMAHGTSPNTTINILLLDMGHGTLEIFLGSLQKSDHGGGYNIAARMATSFDLGAFQVDRSLAMWLHKSLCNVGISSNYTTMGSSDYFEFLRMAESFKKGESPSLQHRRDPGTKMLHAELSTHLAPLFALYQNLFEKIAANIQQSYSIAESQSHILDYIFLCGRGFLLEELKNTVLLPLQGLMADTNYIIDLNQVGNAKECVAIGAANMKQNNSLFDSKIRETCFSCYLGIKDEDYGITKIDEWMPGRPHGKAQVSINNRLQEIIIAEKADDDASQEKASGWAKVKTSLPQIELSFGYNDAQELFEITCSNRKVTVKQIDYLYDEGKIDVEQLIIL